MDDLANLHLSNMGGFEPVPEALSNVPASGDDPKKRRPPNAFLLFCIDYRAKAREENPLKPNIDISRLLADMWRDLPDEERAPYKVRAKEAQEIFKRQNPDYRYDKAKTKRLSKKGNEYDPKHHIELPDIGTLVNLPPEQLRDFVQFLQGHLIMCQQNYQYLQQDSEPAFQHSIDEQFGHDVFPAGQQM